MTDSKYHSKIDRAFADRGLKFGSLGYDEYQGPYLKAAAEGNKTKQMKLLEQRAPEGEAKDSVKHIREGFAIMEGK